MKIIGLGQNYVNDIHDLPKEEVTPFVFFKPDSSLLKDNQDFVLPNIPVDIWYEVEIAFRIGTTCKQATRENALSHVDALAIANDLTGKDDALVQKGEEVAWPLAKGFDGATPIGVFHPISDFTDIYDINFSFSHNGVEKQKGNTSLMITKLEQSIVYLSGFMTLNPGDIILTGTPAHGAEKIKSGDVMVGLLEGKTELTTRVV